MENNVDSSLNIILYIVAKENNEDFAQNIVMTI